MLDVSVNGDSWGRLIFLCQSVPGKKNKDRNTNPTQERTDFIERVPDSTVQPGKKVHGPGDSKGTFVLLSEAETLLVHEVVDNDTENGQPFQFIALFPCQIHRLKGQLSGQFPVLRRIG